jgi:hypothetical protein
MNPFDLFVLAALVVVLWKIGKVIDRHNHWVQKFEQHLEEYHSVHEER